MATSGERLKILGMVSEGKISAEEGVRLLQALQSSGKKAGNGRDPRWLHIRVTDLKTGQTKVNVNIPMSLVNVGIKMGARFAPTSVDFDYTEVMHAIRAGTTGKIVDIEDQTEGERVEIWSE
ncbi:MAG: hypothetical protein ABI947_24860 [Chloroflexota bacterium]